MRIFWKKGYEGASLPDLTEAMGINRPSMYSAFGNKESLFRKVMERYVQNGTTRVNDCLSATSARDGVRNLMRGLVEFFTDPGSPGGCLVMQGQATCADASPEMQHYISQKKAATELALRRRMERAVEEGELPPETSTADLARYFAVMLQGIASQAKSGGTREELMAVVEMAMERWPERSVV